MFILRAVATFHGLQGLVALFVMFFLGTVGFLVQYCLTRQSAHLLIKLFPCAISMLFIVILMGFSSRWVSIPYAFYNSLVRGGILSVWGICAESFFLGSLICLLTTLVRLILQFRK